jgi:hypothetical protein
MIITNLLAAVLEIAYKPFLQALELGDLQGQALACSLKVLRALGQILATFYTGRCGSKGTLRYRQIKSKSDINVRSYHRQGFSSNVP